MIELFHDLPESLSPREAWKRQHGIQTRQSIETDEWLAWSGGIAENVRAEGETEDEALFRLASLLGIEPWK